MKEYKHIDHLIDKFYNGETSLEEEKQLHVFFEGEDIPDHLKSYQDQFLASGLMAKVEGTISEKTLFSKLDDLPKEETRVVKMKPSPTVWFYRVAAAVALIMVGFWAGNQLKPDGRMTEIEAQLNEMKQIMFTQLESSSASGRLQAVSNSMNLEDADDETVDVLIALLKNDKSMHVRTKTVEALTKFGNNKKISKAFSDALLNEDEPAVQIALIEGLVTLKKQGTIEILEKLTENDAVLKEVQDEAHLGIFKLKEL